MSPEPAHSPPYAGSRDRHILQLQDALENVDRWPPAPVRAMDERVVWSGTAAAGNRAVGATDSWPARAGRDVRRAIDRRIVRPVVSAVRAHRTLARVSIATAAVLTGGAILGTSLPSQDEGVDAPPAVEDPEPAAEVPVAPAVAGPLTLDGVSPDFEPGRSATDREVPDRAVPEVAAADRGVLEEAAADRAVPKPVRVRAQPPPQTPAARAAWRFAQAFVLYEVGRAEQAAEELEPVSTRALLRSLRHDPLRLPADVKVPRADVLNVVMGERKGDRVMASVALARLQSVSELRLGLRRTGDGWRVAEVLG